MNSLLAPDLRKSLGELARRIGILERRVSSSTASTASDSEVIFSYAGALSSAVESPPVKVRYGGFLSVLAVAFGNAGSSSTTIDVKRNNAVIATVVVGSGVSDYIAEINVRIDAEDRISLEVTTAGTGAASMTAAARFT